MSRSSVCSIGTMALKGGRIATNMNATRPHPSFRHDWFFGSVVADSVIYAW
jgi:hypothetical protein